MANVVINDKHLADIADAIRAKNFSNAKYKPGEMATAIDNLIITSTIPEDSLITRTATEYSNDRVSSIGALTFYQFDSLTSVDFPNVTEVGEQAFYSCSNLTSANMPELVTISGSANTFYGCNLQTIDFPKLTTAPKYCFAANNELVSVNLPSLTIVREGLFSNCWDLENVVLSSATSVDDAFDNCYALNRLDLPKATSFTASTSMSNLDTLILREESKVCACYGKGSLPDGPIGQGTGYIYVPAALVENYKTANNWSSFADQFRAIEDYPEICG